MALGGCTWLPQQSYADSCSKEASSEVILVSVSTFQAMSLPSIFARIVADQRCVSFQCSQPSQASRCPPVSHLPLSLESYLAVKPPARTQMHHSGLDFTASFTEVKEHQASALKMWVCNVCTLRLLHACLKWHAISLTGAERFVGGEIATDSQP